MERTWEPPLRPSGRSYDLGPASTELVTSRTSLRWASWAIGLFVVAFCLGNAVATIADGPQHVTLCGRGSCTLLPASDYPIMIATYLGIASLGPLAIWIGTRRSAPPPYSMELSEAGLRFDSASGHAVTVPWNGGKVRIWICDLTRVESPTPVPGPAIVARVSPLSPLIALTPDARDAILAEVQRRGFEVGKREVTSASRTTSTGTVFYTVKSR